MRRKGVKGPIADYAIEHFSSDPIIFPGTELTYTVCSLCGNSGIIDTTNTAVCARGNRVGKLNYCICANGQLYRYHEMPPKTRDQRGKED